MSVKKVLLTISAMALIAVIAVAGTLAFLQANTSEVKNTFTSASSIIDNSNFILDEAYVSRTAAGDFVKATGADAGRTNAGLTYDNLLQGSKLFKDPTISIKALNQQAYLFVKVTSTAGDKLGYEMAEGWKQIEGTDVWYYGKTNANGDVLAVMDSNAAAIEYPVLKQNGEGDNAYAVTVKTAPEAEVNITFQAYLVQSTNFDNATAAWNGTFGK